MSTGQKYCQNALNKSSRPYLRNTVRWEEIRIFRDGEEEQEELGILVIGFEMKIHNEGLPG